VQLAKVVEQKETVFMRCLAAFMNVNRRIMSRNPFDEVLRDYDCMSGPPPSTACGKMWYILYWKLRWKCRSHFAACDTSVHFCVVTET
jgi:hypothetical protein